MDKILFDGAEIVLGEVVWAYEYETETLSKNVTLRKEPVQGVILKNESTKPRSWRDDYHFYEIGKSGKVNKSKKVRARNRRYAQTKEDAVKGYNGLIERHIKELMELANFHKGNMINQEGE